MSWFKKIFEKETKQKTSELKKSVIDYAHLNYPPKILLAWIKAIEGNKDLELYLLDNGWEELFYLNQAMKLKDEARNWLLVNGFPHLLAFVNASEGNESAQKWLQVHGFETLFHTALAIEGENLSYAWLKSNTNELIFGIASTYKKMKDTIEFNHNDMYSIGKDQ